MDAFQVVKKTIKEQEMAGAADRIIVGFSGGPDSTCLLHCLWRLFGSEPLTAVHIDHMLRGCAAAQDARDAAEFCRTLGVPFFLCRADVKTLAARLKISEEDAGRRVRYFVFGQVREWLTAKADQPAESAGRPSGNVGALHWELRSDGTYFCEAGAAALENELSRFCGSGENRCGSQGRILIAVAQNADDQAETVLMRILRGTGVSGLGAMEYVRRDGVIRPLLDVPRQSVEDYCAAHELHPSVDATNAEPDYTRNSVRLELLPYLREHFNQSIDQALNRLADAAGQDAAFLDAEANARFLQVLVSEEPAAQGQDMAGQAAKRVFLDRNALKEQHTAMRRRILMLAFARIGLSRDISAVHLRGAERLICTGKEGSTAEFPRGFRMRLRGGNAECFREEAAAAEKNKMAEAEGAVGSYELRVRELSASEIPRDAARLHCFDREAIERSPFDLVLRTRMPGDWMRPLGMNGTKKLQDFLVDKKVPRELRDQIFLVCLGQEVVWAADVPAGSEHQSYIGEPYKVRPDSERILEIRIVRKQ